MAVPLRQVPPAWINSSPLLVDAYSLAVAAHGEQRRPSDGRYFLDHVVEVAELLQSAGFDDELVAVGLLLSDILGLRRGVETAGEGIEGRIGTSVASMTAHYGESVAMIESLRPGSAFLPELRLEMERLEADVFGESNGR